MLGTYDLRFRITAISTINITIEMSLQTIWRWKYCPNNYRGKKKIQNMKQHQFEKFKRRWNRSKKCPATSHSSKHTKKQQITFKSSGGISSDKRKAINKIHLTYLCIEQQLRAVLHQSISLTLYNSLCSWYCWGLIRWTTTYLEPSCHPIAEFPVEELPQQASCQ